VSPVLEYIVNSLGWSLAGFAAGWAVASLRRDVNTIKEAVMDDEDTRDSEPPRARMTVDTATRWLGIVVALLAIVTVTQGVISQRRINAVTECQADYNNRFAEVSQRRAALAEEDRDALQRMLITLYQKRDATSEQRLRIFERWVETVQRNNRERTEHPLPQLPEGDCR
jgi:hypothetical protein